MGTSYWDPYGTGITGGTSTASSWYSPLGSTAASTNAGSWYYIRTVRKILVRAPEKWTDEQNMEFVELVNLKTKTGWKVTLVIKGGDILITDPNVERRTMIEFVPLLKDEATSFDRALINEFFEKNPCV